MAYYRRLGLMLTYKFRGSDRELITGYGFQRIIWAMLNAYECKQPERIIDFVRQTRPYLKPNVIITGPTSWEICKKVNPWDVLGSILFVTGGTYDVIVLVVLAVLWFG